MESFGWLSVLPPVLAIGLAIVTKRVFVSLGFFVVFGWTLMSNWNPIDGVVESIRTMANVVFDSPDNARVLLFSALIGAMITFTQRSGGMQGFVNWAEKSGVGSDKRKVGVFTWLVSMFVSLESNFGLLVSGSIARPLFDRAKISREKLAYVIDATCAPKCILIPINAWGAYVVSLLTLQAVENPVNLVVAALPLNFYAILALSLAMFLILTGKDYGPMAVAQKRVEEEGKLLRDGATPLVSAQVSSVSSKEGVPQRPINMVAPIVTMVVTVPVALLITGSGDILAGSGSWSVLWGVIVGLSVASILYLAQGIMTPTELVSNLVRGVRGLVPLVVVLWLAFAIGATTTALGTGNYVAQAAQASVPIAVVPALIFLLGCFIAFSTGTSWGTFAIMIPIVMPMVALLGLSAPLALAAALGGGIFGDHCSPISDSTVVASMAAATDHIDHVRTQLPYSLTAAGGAVVLFLIFGTFLHG